MSAESPDLSTSAGRALDQQHPWPGLRSFAEDETDFFFGRERETGELLELVGRSAVTVLYGQSGLGKTSLLRAGLFPPLRTSGHLPVWVRLDHASDAPPLARQVLDRLVEACAAAGVEAAAPRDDDSLWTYFHRQDADFWGARNRLVTPVIVLDQFEELFTLGQRDAEAAQRSTQFARELEAQLEQRPPAAVREHLDRYPEDAAEYDLGREAVHFIVSLREDYLPHLDTWRDRLPSILARRFRLEPMTGLNALEVVQRAGGALVDPAAAAQIVAFVASNAGGLPAEASVPLERMRVEPAILSVVCDELNLRRLRAGLPRITPELLSGERASIIGDFYERSFEGIDDVVRDWVEDELLTATGHRDRAALEDARRAGIDLVQIETLVDRRVMHSDEQNQVVWLEFTHDLLTEPALASREARQQRHADARAAEQVERARQREAEVRAKLRRVRLERAAWAAMAILMSVIALTLKHTLHAAEEAKQAAKHAELRWIAAESKARKSLSQAEWTAIELAGQSIDDLRAQWLSPGYNSIEVVRANLARMDTLVERFGELPLMHVYHQHALALASAIQFERGSERECSRLAESAQVKGQQLTLKTEPAQLAAAMTELALAQCLQMRGRYTDSAKRWSAVEAMAQSLLDDGPERRRLLVRGALGQVRADLMQFNFDSAAQRLRGFKAAAGQDACKLLLDPEAAAACGVQVLEAEGRLALSKVEGLAAHRAARALIDTLPQALRDAPAWRFRMLNTRLREADSLYRMDRNPEALVVADRALVLTRELLAADPAHNGLRLLENRLGRVRAEVLQAWRREHQAQEERKAIETSARRLAAEEPLWFEARYMEAVSAWLRRQEQQGDSQAQLERAVRLFGRLAHDVPEAGDGVRSFAVSKRDMHEVELDLASRLGPADAKVKAHHDMKALTHLRQGLKVLESLRSADRHPLVADIVGDLESRAGSLEVSLNQPGAALRSYQRAADQLRQVPVTAANATERAFEVSYPELFVVQLLRQAGKESEALAVEQRMLSSLEKAREQAPQHFDLGERLAWAHRMAAADYLDRQNFQLAVKRASQAAGVLAQLLRDDPLSVAADKSLLDLHRWIETDLKPKLVAGQLSTLMADIRKTLQDTDPSQDLRRSTVSSTVLLTSLADVPGDWEHLGPQRLRAPEFMLGPEIDRLAKLGWQTLRARRLDLPFYQHAHLVELDLHNAQGETTAVDSFVTDDKGIAFHVGGTAQDIAAYNATHDLNLELPSQARLYMRIFIASLDTDQGMVRLIDHPKDLAWSAGALPGLIEDTNRLIDPLELRPREDGSWDARVTIQSGTWMFRARYSLMRNGRLAGFHSASIQRELPILSERYDKGLRVRMETYRALSDTARKYANEKDWKAAAKAQQRSVDLLLSKPEKDDERVDRLAGSYVSLSWYRLFNQEPLQALAAADDGLAIEPDSLPLQANRAHALLLLGRRAEAMKIYQLHVGKPMFKGEPQTWQEVVLDDLNQFDEAGLKDPRFAEIRALMLSAGH